MQTDSLVQSAKNGDTKAFASLYAMYAAELYRYAYFLLGSKEDAEDAVMDTVADAFAGIAKLRDPTLFKHWIFRILSNKAKRQKGIRYEKQTLELLPDQADEQSFSESDYLDRADLAAAFSSLAEQDRQIIALSVIAGYRSEEIAEILGMNHNSVRSRKQRALEKMRIQLEERKEGTQ